MIRGSSAILAYVAFLFTMLICLVGFFLFVLIQTFGAIVIVPIGLFIFIWGAMFLAIRNSF